MLLKAVEMDGMYIRNKLDLIESTLQLIHEENLAIAKGMCAPQYGKELTASWNKAMDDLISRYKESTRMEVEEDGE